MRDLNSLKKQIVALQAKATAAAADSRSAWDFYYRATPEQKREQFIDLLAGPSGLAAEAFGANDPRACQGHLCTLTLSQLCGLFREAAKVLAPRAVSPEERAWFRSLPHSERIRILRSDDVGSHYKRVALE